MGDVFKQIAVKIQIGLFTKDIFLYTENLSIINIKRIVVNRKC